MRPLFRFVGLSFKSKPTAAAAALLLMVAGLNVQDIVRGIATDARFIAWASQWWTPWVFAFFAFWTLAYVFWRQSEADRGLTLRPDLTAADAFKTILSRSKRAKAIVRKHYELLTLPVRSESYFTEAGVMEERLKRRLREEIHDALRQGHISAWGTPRDGGPETEIRADEWAEFEIQFDDAEIERIPWPIGGPPPIAAWQRKPNPRGASLCYANIRFSKENLYREFPLALWPRRIDFVPLKQNRGDVATMGTS